MLKPILIVCSTFPKATNVGLILYQRFFLRNFIVVIIFIGNYKCTDLSQTAPELRSQALAIICCVSISK